MDHFSRRRDSSLTGKPVNQSEHSIDSTHDSTALESITAEVDVDVTDNDELDIVEMCNTWGGIPAKNHKGENLLLFIGIIDVLQSYGVAKKLEHTLKSIVYDGDKVSVHRPAFYAKRFRTFLSDKVFKKMPPNLKPALSIRRPLPPPKRLVSRVEQTESEGADNSRLGTGDKEKASSRVVERMSVDNSSSVTVITIGGAGAETSQTGAGPDNILPAVLRDKPRAVSSVSAPARDVSKQARVTRPDVADVEGVACTPPPDLGITSDDERIQIYVPSPQSTPYSTISRHVPDTHKNITQINYRDKSESPDNSVSIVQEKQNSLVEVYQKSHQDSHHSSLQVKKEKCQDWH